MVARIDELQSVISESVVNAEIRDRSARVDQLQINLNAMLEVSRLRSIQYADHPLGASGLLIRDFRGRNCKQEVWRFDAALEKKILETLKQAAIEENQWMQKRR